MPTGGRGNASDKGKERGCSPCCAKTVSEESPPMLPAKPLYSGDVMKPTQGTLPSSKAGFLVSFLVDARGGAMTGHRHWGMRVIIPPAAVQQPTRINCRYQQLTSLPFPPPFMEREALASRVIEVTPAGETFRSPVLIEIPHFASNAGAEREIIVLRSDDGETWYEHVSDEVENGEIYQDVVTSVVMKDSDLERIYDVLEVTKGRIIRILTSKFPKYFAVLTRVREEVKSVGPDGGKVVLLHEPRLRATFPKNALYKKIKVGLQVQSLKPEIVQAAFGRSVEVSKMIALEPRKRKFHQPIFISIPLPCSPSKINSSTSIRLLCSVTGATDKAVWADLTGSTPLELCKDVVHFSTKVSAIFWLLVIHDKQRDPESALTLASRLYEESILIPYLARFSIFYRENFPRAWVNTIRVYCMTDDKAEKVIKSLQGFRPLAISGDVEVPHTSSISVKLSGNVIQLRQDPFTGELLAVSSIRTSEVKEPFVFKAFEDNSMTILVQPKDPAQPLSGCLSFGRRLDHISATQQLPLCEMRFDVSGGDTSSVIKEDMMFQTTEFETGVNGHTPDIIDAPPPMKTFKTIEEEDPYEKIEIKKNKDGMADIKTKPSQDAQKQNLEIPKGKKEKKEKAQASQKAEAKENSKSTINQSTKTSVTKSSQDKTIGIELKSETQKKLRKPEVQSNMTAGSCVHDVKISDFCHNCSGDQKSFERSAAIVPQENQEDNIKGSVIDKQINNEGGIERKIKVSNKIESKSISDKKLKAEKLDNLSGSCIHDIHLADFCKNCAENQKSLDRRSSKKDVGIEQSEKKEEKVIEEELAKNKGDKEKIDIKKPKKEKKTEMTFNDESQSLASKKQYTKNTEISSNKCIHDIPLAEVCRSCIENQKSLDRRAPKIPTEETKKAEEIQNIKEETVINRSIGKEETNKEIKKKNEDNKTKLDDTERKSGNSKKKDDKKSIDNTGPRSCIHAVPLAEICQLCEENQRSLSRTRTKTSEEKNTTKAENTSNKIKAESKKDVEHVSVIKENDVVTSCEGNEKSIHSKGIDDKLKKEKDNLTESKKADEQLLKSKKSEESILDTRKKEASLRKSKEVKEKGPKHCIHNIPITDICKSCEENQRSLSIESPRMLEETDGKTEKKKVKKELNVNELKDKEDAHASVSKEVFHNLDTGVKLCIHDVLIEDFCQTCSESQVKAGIETVTVESEGKSTKKSNENTNTEYTTHTLHKSEESKRKNEATIIETKEIQIKKESKSTKDITQEEINESELKKKETSRGKSKTQEFKANELEALRVGFAKKQGVKETSDMDTSQTTNKNADANISQLEERSVFQKSSDIKATTVSIAEFCQNCDGSQAQTQPNDIPIKEERKKKGRKSKAIEEIEPVYEPVGTGNEAIPLQVEKNQEFVGEIITKEEDFEDTNFKSGGIVDDFKDFSSLKRKKKTKAIIAEPKLEDASTVEFELGKESNDNVLITDTKLKRNDDVIGFDIGITNDNTNPFVTEEEFEEIVPIEESKQSAKTNECESPSKTVPPPLPARRKNSKQSSSSESAQNVSLAAEEKEKKTSFVKEWQKDLKEFFSLGKKKKRDTSLSRGSSSKRSDTDSRQGDLSKYDKNQDENEASKVENISKGKTDRFSSILDTKSSKEKSSENGGNLPENEDIYGYTKDPSVDVDTADKPVSMENQQISNKPDDMPVDESVERRKKKRRDRRKTNSESSSTKVEIPAYQVDDEAKIPTKTWSDNSSSCCIHDVPLSDFCKNCSENQNSLTLRRRSSKIPTGNKDAAIEKDKKRSEEEPLDLKSSNKVETNKEGNTTTNEKDTKVRNNDESKSIASKKQNTKNTEISSSTCIHDIPLAEICKICKDNQTSLDRRAPKKPIDKDESPRENAVKKAEETPTIKKEKSQKTEMSSKKCIHDIRLMELCKDCDENQKSLDRRGSKKPVGNESSANTSSNIQFDNVNKEAQEEPTKQVRKRNKKGKINKVESVVTDAEIKMDETTLPIGSKPVVMVPSPPGIPRPRPINKRDTNRDSRISDDGDFVLENLKTERTGSLEETEEFRKAVESFDQIYLLESANQSPEIASSRSSTLSNKLAKPNEDPKPDVSPNVAWKRLKTGKSFDESDSISSRNQSHSQVTEITSQSSEVGKSEMKYQSFEHQDSTCFSESKSVDCSQSSIVKTKKSSKQISMDMSLGMSNDSNDEKVSSVASKNLKGEENFEDFQSCLSESNLVESQSQSYQSSTVEEKKSTKKMMKKGMSIEVSDSSESQSTKSEKMEKQESIEVSENNRINQEHKFESSQSSKVETNKSSKKNKKNRKSTDVSEKNISNNEEIKAQENTISSSIVQSSQQSKTENKTNSKKSKKGKNLDLPDKSDDSPVIQTESSNIVQSRETIENKTSSEKIKKGKSLDLQDKSDESPAMSVKSEISLESPEVELRKSSGKVDKKETAKEHIKHDSLTMIEQAYQESLPVPIESSKNESKTSSKKSKKGKSQDLPESGNNQVMSVKPEVSLESPQDEGTWTMAEKNSTTEENLHMQTGPSRKISILGAKYDVDPTKLETANNSSYVHEDFIQETTSWKKESKGFLSDEEREELEKENALVKAIREFQASESTHSEVSSHVLSDGDFSNEVKYSELEKQIIQKSMDAQETIKTALQDIEKTTPLSQGTTATPFVESRLGDLDNSETMRVQKHSLSIQDGVLIEQTTTERFSHLPGGQDGQTDSCTIDPESLKNVDGQPKQRKGSARFSKRQGSKSKSPGLGGGNSFSGPDDREEDEETFNNTDLTTRLEETNVRMKKLSEVFNVMCDEPGVEPKQEMTENDMKIAEENTRSFEADERQTAFHPLTRTTQIIRKECPLDEVIGTMIQKPENLSSSSQFSSSVENSPLMYRAVVVHQSREENTPSSPLMYRAVVTQRLEEREEHQGEELL